MADDLKAGDVPQNVESLSASIIDGFKGRLADRRAIASAMEQHVAPLRKSMNKSWGDLSNDSGIPKKRLKKFYDLWELQEEAKAFADEDERDRAIDDMRTLFNALSKGEQLDFLPVLESAA